MAGSGVRRRLGRVRLGVLLRLSRLGVDPAPIADFVREVEAAGFDYVESTEHVLGANPASRPGWDGLTNAVAFHDPFVLFGFLAGVTSTIGFASGVLILPQRQTVIVAKQAATVDVLSGGRFRLGVGVGMLRHEYEGLGEDFTNRGARSEEQLQLLRALWAQEHVTFEGRWHRIDDAGINPRPPSGAVPLWIGGSHERTIERVAKWGDGWMPNTFRPDDTARDAFSRLRQLTEAAGRDPDAVGVETAASLGDGTEDDWRDELLAWKRCGATHLTVDPWAGPPTAPGASDAIAESLARLRRFRDAVADLR